MCIGGGGDDPFAPLPVRCGTTPAPKILNSPIAVRRSHRGALVLCLVKRHASSYSQLSFEYEDAYTYKTFNPDIDPARSLKQPWRRLVPDIREFGTRIGTDCFELPNRPHADGSVNEYLSIGIADRDQAGTGISLTNHGEIHRLSISY
jgi:hypothetical protein